MITEEQLREALKRCTDEDTHPLGDEVPSPEPPPRGDRPWADYHSDANCWLKGVSYRRNGLCWSDTVGEIEPICAGWIAQQIEWLRWQHRDDNICPTCFGEPARSGFNMASGSSSIPEDVDLDEYEKRCTTFECADGHHWHWCPAHGVKVEGRYGYGRRIGCTCGKEAES